MDIQALLKELHESVDETELAHLANRGRQVFTQSQLLKKCRIDQCLLLSMDQQPETSSMAYSLREITQQNKELHDENQVLRQEVEDLRRKLTTEEKDGNMEDAIEKKRSQEGIHEEDKEQDDVKTEEQSVLKEEIEKLRVLEQRLTTKVYLLREHISILSAENVLYNPFYTKFGLEESDSKFMEMSDFAKKMNREKAHMENLIIEYQKKCRNLVDENASLHHSVQQLETRVRDLDQLVRKKDGETLLRQEEILALHEKLRIHQEERFFQEETKAVEVKEEAENYDYSTCPEKGHVLKL